MVSVEEASAASSEADASSDSTNSASDSDDTGSESDSDDTGSVSGSDGDSAEGESSADESGEDDDDNQASEAAEQKRKAVEDDVAAMLAMATHMEKVRRRLQFRYGDNRKVPELALAPAPLEAPKEEQPEAASPPKPQVFESALTVKEPVVDESPVALEEVPKEARVTQDASTDSTDLQIDAKEDTTTAFEATPSSPPPVEVYKLELDPRLMRDIALKSKPKPVVAHIAPDCQLKLALATEPALHLQDAAAQVPTAISSRNAEAAAAARIEHSCSKARRTYRR
ncbi:hypothetical protein ACHHYP_05754 [Achlya hypogyna]|uniref:Uncharacterized protein n=1 Tax=Achlya hypogyna TaxID=1202772 RepID=A0A1V9ZNP4_ACHHY|nr:hypothetical protein ACHHYP_05754 [Achlya hypogyna]